MIAVVMFILTALLYLFPKTWHAKAHFHDKLVLLVKFNYQQVVFSLLPENKRWHYGYLHTFFFQAVMHVWRVWVVTTGGRGC